MFPQTTMKLLTSRSLCITIRICVYLLYVIGGYWITRSFKKPLSFLDSLLYIVVTVTTIGYGNVTPDTNVAKCLVVAFVLGGTVLSTYFGNPIGDLVDAAADQLEKWFFRIINPACEKKKHIWKSVFAIVWILIVVCSGIFGILKWDVAEMNMGDESKHALGSAVNATYFSVVSAYTIGYGDFNFSATAGKVFALVWLPLGTAIVSSATSYLRKHRRWICAICVRKDKKTKAMLEVKSKMVPGQEFENGTLVEAKRALKKHCHESTNADASGKLITAVLLSRIYEFKSVQIRDLEPARKCSEVFSSTARQVKILLKREDCSDKLISSYKWRGTYNFIANAPIEMKRRGFTCAFRKQALIVAHVAELLKFPCIVAVPKGYFSAGQPDQVVRKKLRDALSKCGTDLAYGKTCIQECDDYAKRVAKDQGMTYVPPCDHTDIITGYGTIGMEIIFELIQAGTIDSLHSIFIPIGDGNLIAGIAAYVKRVLPKVKIFGVEERTTSVMAWSFNKGGRVFLEKQNGEVVEAIGKECFSICVEFLDGIIIVNDEAISTVREHITTDTLKRVSPVCIAGVQWYCRKYATEVCNKIIVAVIDE